MSDEKNEQSSEKDLRPKGPKDEGEDHGADLPLTTYDPENTDGELLPDPRAERGDAV